MADTAATAQQTTIDVCDRLSYREFVADYLRPNRPVVVTGAIDAWTALERWTPDFFRDHYGDRSAEIDDLTIGELVDLVEAAEHDAATDLPYLRNYSIDRHAPELRSDIEPMPTYLQPNWLASPLVPKRISRYRTDLFIGGRGGGFPYLHFDNYHGHAFVFQVYGEKEFVCIPPEQTPLVYPRATHKGQANASSIGDVDAPDLDRFPRFAEATLIRCTIRSGEMLFVPAGWWHTTKMHTVSITVSSNIANRSNWSMLMADHWKTFGTSPATALAGVPYLGLVRAIETARDVAYRDRRLAASDASAPR